ncbi:MAG TPA: PAS domain S-box protein [Epulopiscium sp.]|nr:PAS domain S-box protein [Candidatus Epulonipiscium sp.]
MKNVNEEETNFHNLFETIDDMFIISGLDGAIVHANPALINKLEYSLEELKQMHIIELYPVKKREKTAIIVEEMLASKRKYCSLEVESKRGNIYFLETRIWYGKWNQEDCIYSISKDVTKTIELTKSLEDKLQKLTNIIEGTNLGTWEWNLQTGELECNEQWAGMVGYSLEELEPIRIETWHNLVHPQDLKSTNEMIQKHIDGEISFYDLEIRMKHKDGRWIWVQDRGKVIERDKHGQPIKMFGTHADVTLRREADEVLKESENRFF